MKEREGQGWAPLGAERDAEAGCCAIGLVGQNRARRSREVSIENRWVLEINAANQRCGEGSEERTNVDSCPPRAPSCNCRTRRWHLNEQSFQYVDPDAFRVKEEASHSGWLRLEARRRS